MLLDSAADHASAPHTQQAQARVDFGRASPFSPALPLQQPFSFQIRRHRRERVNAPLSKHTTLPSPGSPERGTKKSKHAHTQSRDRGKHPHKTHTERRTKNKTPHFTPPFLAGAVGARGGPDGAAARAGGGGGGGAGGGRGGGGSSRDGGRRRRG